MLAGRLVTAVDWLVTDPDTHGLSIGCFGSSTGAAAAFIAAKERPALTGPLVSRGGRPDLVAEVLGQVTAPSLLYRRRQGLQGAHAQRGSARQDSDGKKLEILPGATHLFEER